jgi:hypothetical protein
LCGATTTYWGYIDLRGYPYGTITGVQVKKGTTWTTAVLVTTDSECLSSGCDGSLIPPPYASISLTAPGSPDYSVVKIDSVKDGNAYSFSFNLGGDTDPPPPYVKYGKFCVQDDWGTLSDQTAAAKLPYTNGACGGLPGEGTSVPGDWETMATFSTTGTMSYQRLNVYKDPPCGEWETICSGRADVCTPLNKHVSTNGTYAFNVRYSPRYLNANGANISMTAQGTQNGCSVTANATLSRQKCSATCGGGVCWTISIDASAACEAICQGFNGTWSDPNEPQTVISQGSRFVCSDIEASLKLVFSYRRSCSRNVSSGGLGCCFDSAAGALSVTASIILSRV